MLDKNLVSEVLSTALQTGGDFAELYVEHSVDTGISMINKIVEKANTGIDYGAGIRIFNGFNAIYAYTNDTSRENLLLVAKEASEALKKNNSINNVIPFMVQQIENRHKIKISPTDFDKKNIVDFLRQSAESSLVYSDLVTETSGRYINSIKDVLVANSNGLWAEDRRVITRVTISAIASKGSEKQTGTSSPGAHVGPELLEYTNPVELGKKSATTAVTMINADLCPSGTMPVVIGNGFGGVIFHEACGHSLEATFVAKGTSVFHDKLGEQIASSCVTAIDDGTLANSWGSQNIDDEGTPMKRNVLIENGVLKSFLVDTLNGKKMGMDSTGSSRRQNYRYAPTSRMTNTFIDNGTDKFEDMISEIDYGLFAKQMGGGSVTPATGEFNFAVTEGYLIRNGKIVEPVRGATLIGKGSEVLHRIDRVSDDLEQGQGMCGSISGAVPTNVGQPTIRVKELIVGGREN